MIDLCGDSNPPVVIKTTESDPIILSPQQPSVDPESDSLNPKKSEFIIPVKLSRCYRFSKKGKWCIISLIGFVIILLALALTLVFCLRPQTQISIMSDMNVKIDSNNVRMIDLAVEDPNLERNYRVLYTRTPSISKDSANTSSNSNSSGEYVDCYHFQDNYNGLPNFVVTMCQNYSAQIFIFGNNQNQSLRLLEVFSGNSSQNDNITTNDDNEFPEIFCSIMGQEACEKAIVQLAYFEYYKVNLTSLEASRQNYSEIQNASNSTNRRMLGWFKKLKKTINDVGKAVENVVSNTINEVGSVIKDHGAEIGAVVGGAIGGAIGAPVGEQIDAGVGSLLIGSLSYGVSHNDDGSVNIVASQPTNPNSSPTPTPSPSPYPNPNPNPWNNPPPQTGVVIQFPPNQGYLNYFVTNDMKKCNGDHNHYGMYRLMLFLIICYAIFI